VRRGRLASSESDGGPNDPRLVARRDVLVALVLAALTILLGVLIRTAPVPTDPWHYVESARAFPSRNWIPVGYTRYGMVLPLIPLLAALHRSQATYALPALLSSGVLVAVIYLLGKRVAARAVGIGAVALFLSNPVVILNLTRSYPDLPATALVGLALLLAIVGSDRRRTDVASRRSEIGLLLAIGFLLGWSVEVRETAVLLWPVVVWVVLRDFPWRSWVAVAGPVLAWVAAELTISGLSYGDPLLRLRVLSGSNLAGTTNVADQPYLGHPRLYYLTVVPDATLRGPGGRVTLLIGILGLLGLVLLRGRQRLMAFWFAIPLLGYTAVGGGLSPAHPSIRLDVQRYWLFFLPGMSLTAAVLLYQLVLRLRLRVTAPTAQGRLAPVLRGLPAAALACLCVATVVPAARLVSTSQLFPANGGSGFEQMRTYVAALPDNRRRVIWSDWQTLRILPVFQSSAIGRLRWQSKYKSLTGPGQPQVGDLVLGVARAGSPCPFCGDNFAVWRRAHPVLPPSWRVEWRSTNDTLRLYRVRAPA